MSVKKRYILVVTSLFFSVFGAADGMESADASDTLAVKAVTMTGREPFAEPFSTIGGSENLLTNNNFALTYSADKVKKKNLIRIKDGLMPVNWEIDNRGSGAWASGKLELGNIQLPDGTEGHSILWEMPENKWDSADLVCLQHLDSAKMQNTPYYGGFWARGDGTLTMRFKEHSKAGSSTIHDSAFLISPEWRFYRTPAPVLPKNDKDSFVTVQFQLYGRAEIAMPEIAPMPAVDSSAELTLYVPFDNGNPAARFSRGVVEVLGYGEIMPGAEGVDGQTNGAMRFDRKRHFTPAGFLRVQMGLNYEGTRSILDKESGTLELWMRPLAEMASPQKWEPFPVFNCGKQMGKWSKGTAPLSVFIRRTAENHLEIVLAESNLLKEWPTHNREAFDSTCKEYAFKIGPAEDFVGKWHHIALTYDKKERSVFLDGKKVINAPAMKVPALYYNNTLQLATGNIASPSVISSDVDEFRVYRGVRYHSDFMPEKTTLDFQPCGNPAEDGAASFISSRLRVGAPSLNEQKTAFSFPVHRGTEEYELELSLGNGYPLLFSSKDAAMNIIVSEHPKIPDLIIEHPQMEKEKVSGEISKRGTFYSWNVKPHGDKLSITLELDKRAGDWSAYVEGRVALKNKNNNAWSHHFDGFGVREILAPFRPFAFDEMILALPVSGAWNSVSGMCIALNPDMIVSYVSRGMKSPEKLELAVRSVLDNGDKMIFSFEVFPFSGKYGEKALTDAYHGRHPEFFARKKEVDPRVYGGASIYAPWETKIYQERKKEYSHQEINRRAGCTWHWLYKSGTSTGNWAPDMEILSELSMLNKFEVANADYHKNIRSDRTRSYYETDRKTGIDQALYISQWLEKRFVPYFRDSVFDDYETQSSGVEFINGYWWQLIADYIGIQSGTSYGKWLRKQLRGLLENHKGVNAFAHDEFVGDYYFRKKTDLGGIRAFDENGAYVHNLSAMGKFCADITAIPNTTPYRTAIIGNARIQNSGFPAVFWLENNIYERTMHQAVQDWTTLRQHTRMMGEKPDSFFGSTSIIGNYFNPDKDDIRLTKYLFTLYHQQQILLGMLFNVNMKSDLINGIKEGMEKIGELRRIHDMGYRHVTAFECAPSVLNVRYGEASHGALVLVNPSFEERPGYGKVDPDYLGALPLLAEQGCSLTVDGCSFAGNVKPHSWRVIEMSGAAKGVRDLQYTSKLELAPDGRLLDFKFQKEALIPELVIGLTPNETIASIELNGNKISFKAREGNVSIKDLQLAPNDTLTIKISDRRWKSSAGEIVNMPFLDGKKLAIVCRGKSAEYEGKRLQEYFRFWTARQKSMDEFTPPIFPDMPDDASSYPVIVLFEEGPEGISLEKNVITIREDADHLARLTDVFFNTLDSRFRYYGVFGHQVAIREWDYTTTKEQKNLQEKCNVIKRLLSVEEDARGFREWLESAKPNLADGF